MSKKVFVLGAGASSHFGYPLGKELIDAMAYFYGEYLKPKNVPDAKIYKQLIDELRSYNPINIDYFLKHSSREDFKKQGNKLIGHTVWRSECYPAFSKQDDLKKWWGGEFESRNWVKFIYNSIVSKCDKINEVENKLKDYFIITFNYDCSFEQALYHCFKNTKFSKDNEFKKVLENFYKENIYHVYGKIPQCYEYEGKDLSIDAIVKRFERTNIEISTIGEDKSKNIGDKYSKIICDSEHVYFLGYGFDVNNNNALGLKEVLRNCKHNKTIYYTNSENGLKIDMVLASFFNNIIYESSFLRRYRTNNDVVATVVKSVKKVYDALENDFDIAGD